MTTRRQEQARAYALEVERRHVVETGSDDFTDPAVTRQIRDGAGFRTATNVELIETLDRALKDQGIEGELYDAQMLKLQRALSGES